MGNIDRAARLIEAVRAAGAEEFCVCAGSRNAPLLAVLGASNARLFSFVDERSAAFFAIGRGKQHGRPIAVVTTSGTAVAEMLPAAIEAYYSGIPLVLISADRPGRFRGTGAPQSIEQEGIFGVYAETSLETWSRARPLHLNIEFEEPLLEVWEHGTLNTERGTEEGEHGTRNTEHGTWNGEHGVRPLVIIGALALHHRERVKAFARSLQAPVYAESLSGLREDPELPLILSGERMIARGNFDSVIRIGSVPTLRFWRDLETPALPNARYSDLPNAHYSDLPNAHYSDLPVTHYSDLPFAGLTRGEVRPVEALPALRGERDEDFFARDRAAAARFTEILEEEPASELAMFRVLSRELPAGARVYLGNSLPIREWDLAATREPRGFSCEANRGANGIDGQLSTFFGWAAPGAHNVCVIGDLTAIYDLGAPWIVRQLDAQVRIVIVNNGGGRIFGRVASLRALDCGLRERIIENVHDIRFGDWAKMWNLELTELRPDEGASQRAWKKYDELWAPALSGAEG